MIEVTDAPDPSRALAILKCAYPRKHFRGKRVGNTPLVEVLLMPQHARDVVVGRFHDGRREFRPVDGLSGNVAAYARALEAAAISEGYRFPETERKGRYAGPQTPAESVRAIVDGDPLQPRMIYTAPLGTLLLDPDKFGSRVAAEYDPRSDALRVLILDRRTGESMTVANASAEQTQMDPAFLDTTAESRMRLQLLRDHYSRLSQVDRIAF